MIDGKNFFDQPVKNTKITYENFRKIVTGQGDHYTTDCLLDYSFFINSYKVIAIDLSKKQELDADTRAIQQINFTAILDRGNNTSFFFILKEVKKLFWTFHKELLRLSLNMIVNPNDETNFPHKLLLTNRQVANPRKVFAKKLSYEKLNYLR